MLLCLIQDGVMAAAAQVTSRAAAERRIVFDDMSVNLFIRSIYKKKAMPQHRPDDIVDKNQYLSAFAMIQSTTGFCL